MCGFSDLKKSNDGKIACTLCGLIMKENFLKTIDVSDLMPHEVKVYRELTK